MKCEECTAKAQRGHEIAQQRKRSGAMKYLSNGTLELIERMKRRGNGTNQR